MACPAKLGHLTTADWQRLEDLLDRFETVRRQSSPQNDTLALAPYLPAQDDALRLVALYELVKIDLGVCWAQGAGLPLERFLERYPELGTAQSVDAPLIYEEYYARRRYGDKPPLSGYEARFPAQYAELLELVRRQPVPDGPPPPPVPPPPTALAGGVALDHHEALTVGGVYRPVRRIGRGAFGEIWQAEAPGGVEVAIKVIYGALAREAARRELEALELMKRLRHVYLLPIHAFWQMEDRLLIVMELADGSLGQRLEECRKAGERCLPARELLGYCRDAAEALDFLHSRHVIHRDVKPENLLLLQGHAKVADFGLARILSEGQRLITVSISGTPAYTAPEVFWHGKVGPHSDQYSLAATYAELRLGHPLFASRNYRSLMEDHLTRSPDLLPLLGPEQLVLNRALAKEPQQRFGSCREFVEALIRVAAY